MKKTAILIPALFFGLASCNNNTPANTQPAQQAVVAEVSSQIAYINMDSLLANYDMVIELGTAFEEKATKAENDLTAKGRSFERSVADFQEKVEKGLVTRAQAAELEQKLQQQQQTLVNHQNQIQQELAEENQVMMNNIYHSLNTFLDEFNSDQRYGMILSTSGGVPILNADPRLNITEIVLQGLNEKYSRDKKNN